MSDCVVKRNKKLEGIREILSNNILWVNKKGEVMAGYTRYSDELIDEIKSRNDIVDVVSQYVVLKRQGRNYFGLCPFHNEKSPSFAVSPDRQFFHCFGCGVGGNVFHFIMKVENVSFVEAVQILAQRAGIELPTLSSSSEDEERTKLKNEIYKLNLDAAQFYHQNLYKPTSKTAQAYIKKRQLGNNTLKSFLIGYAGTNNELLAYLKSKGYSEKLMLLSCLIGKSKEGHLYDKFRNRIMFPIQDVRNRVIAFGGRNIVQKEKYDPFDPKYLNSPENIVYSKGRNLFGLNVAKRSATNGMLKRILIVEGYMDAISLYQRGITNVVASLGTALTDNQGRLLRRNAEQVILGYDADEPGQKAIMRGINILKSMGVDARVLQISGAKDPDEYVLKYGPDRFRKCMDNAISSVEFKAKVAKKDLNLDNVNDKIKFLNEIAKILSEVENTMEREVYIDKLSKDYNISKEAIYSEVDKLTYKNNPKTKVLERRTKEIVKPQIPVSSIKVDPKTLRREKMLIYLLINYPRESFERIHNIVKLDYIKDEKNKKIISKLYEKLEENLNTENVLDWFTDEDLINYISEILAYDFEITDTNKAIEDVEKDYLKEVKIARRNEIIKELENREISSEEKVKLENELNNVIIDLARMK